MIANWGWYYIIKVLCQYLVQFWRYSSKVKKCSNCSTNRFVVLYGTSLWPHNLWIFAISQNDYEMIMTPIAVPWSIHVAVTVSLTPLQPHLLPCPGQYMLLSRSAWPPSSHTYCRALENTCYCHGQPDPPPATHIAVPWSNIQPVNSS